MATEDLGTLQIGIRADLRDLDRDLAAARDRVKEFRIPSQEIRYKVIPPSQDQIDRAQRQVNRTLQKAATLGVELTPTLSVKNVKISEFRGEIQRLLDGTKPVGVKITADVDGKALRDQILEELGVTDIPLTWHWEGEPPPGDLGGSVPVRPGPGGGGGGGPAKTTGTTQKTSGTTQKTTGTAQKTAGTTQKTSVNKTTDASVPKDTGKVEDALQCHLCDAVVPRNNVLDHFYADHATDKQRAERATAGASASQRVERPKAGKTTQKAAGASPTKGPAKSNPATAKAGAGAAFVDLSDTPDPDLVITDLGSTVPHFRTRAVPMDQRPTRPGPPQNEGLVQRVITRKKAEVLSPEQQLQFALEKLQLGDPGGLTDLLALGVKLTPGEVEEIGLKRGSEAAKMVKANPGLKAQIVAALKKQQEGPKDPLGAREAFSGKALSMAQDIGITPDRAALNAKIRELMSEATSKKQVESYRNDPRVIELKAFMEASGGGEAGYLAAVDRALQAVTPDVQKGLAAATEGRSAEARQIGAQILGRMYAIDPKMGQRLFDAVAPNPINASSGNRGKGTKGGLKREKGLRSQIDREGNYQEVDPGFEISASAIRAIFGEATAGEVPQIDRSRKEAFKMEAAARKGRRKRFEAGQLVDVFDDEMGDAEKAGQPIERERSGVAGEGAVLAAIRGGKKPEDAAREVFTAQVGKETKKGQFAAYFASLDQQAIADAVASRASSVSVSTEGERYKQQVLRELDQKIKKTAPKIEPVDKYADLDEDERKRRIAQDEDKAAQAALRQRVAGIKTQIKRTLGLDATTATINKTYDELFKRHGSIDAVESAVQATLARLPKRAGGGPIQGVTPGTYLKGLGKTPRRSWSGDDWLEGSGPAWVKEGLIRQGIDPGRPLNDIDIQREDDRWAIAQDPTLSLREKINTLKTGSPLGRLTEEEQRVFLEQLKERSRAGGGPVREGPLARRIRERSYLVGEVRPEVYKAKSGAMEIVGQNGPEIRQFPEDGEIIPFVPPWMSRLKAKDLTPREKGGPVEGSGDRQAYVDAIAAVQRGETPIDPDTNKPLTAISKDHALRSLRKRLNALGPEGVYGVPDSAYAEPGRVQKIIPIDPDTGAVLPAKSTPAKPKPAPAPVIAPAPAAAAAPARDPLEAAAAALRFRSGGKFQSQSSASIEAVQKGIASAPGNIQRVFVVNWPAGLTRPPAASAPSISQAAAPFSTGGIIDAVNVVKDKSAKKPKAKKAEVDDSGIATARSTSGGFTPLEEAQLEAQRQDLITAQRLRQKKIAADISASIREAPTRGLQTAAGEISAINLGGLRGVIERRRLAEEASTRATAALNSYATAQQKVEKTTIKLAQAEKPERQAQLAKLLEQQEEAAGFLERRYEGLAKEAENLGKNVISTSDKIKVFGANTFGIIGGTLVFGGALTVAQAAVGGLSQVLSPAFERMTGFKNVTAETVKALGDQIAASGGAVQQTTSLALATVGLSSSSADLVDDLLARRGATEAGNKALQQQIDLLHSYEELSRQNGGSFDRALVSATSGFFATDLGAVPSTAELLGKELAGLPDLSERRDAPGPTIPRGFFNTDTDVVANPAFLRFSEALEIGTTRMEVFNNQAKKGGESTLRLSLVTDEAVNTTADLAALDPRLKDFANTLRTEGIEIKGAKTPEDVLRFLEAVNAGAQRPNPDLLVRQLTERIIPNQLAAFRAEEAFQLKNLIPAQRNLEFLASPPTPFGTGFTQVAQGTNGATPFGPGLTGGIGEFQGVDQTAITSFNTYKSVAQSAIGAVVAKAREGREALLNLGVPPTLIAEIERLGNQAQGIEIGLANRQAEFAAVQYNHQLFILNRNLQDALALAGEQATAAGKLGKLQRENFELGKQQNALQLRSQELSLALTQRQINFQRALAGFQAPGETAEERAARIEQAELEAQYAQEQLDIQKQLLGLGQKQFTLGVTIFDESAQRQVQELQFALGELQQGRQLQLDTTAAQQALAAIRARQAQINSEIGVAIETATKKAGLAISTALDIANKSGEAFNKILVQTATAWDVFVNQGASAVTQLIFGPQNNSGGGRGPLKLASGIVGDTLGPTNITVGEAGTETVAVLRNPRTISANALAGVSPSAGGGVTVIVDVHGNNINEGSMDELVAKISRAVESSINRKTSLLGLRST